MATTHFVRPWRCVLLTLALSLLALSGELVAADYQGLQEINPPADPPNSSIVALLGATLVDGTGSPPLPNSAIVVAGPRIQYAGPLAGAPIPSEAKRIDVSGYTVMPGLLDSHFHIGNGSTRHTIPPLFLSHGVTTARDPGRPIDVWLPLKDADRPMPRMFVTGPHFDQAPPAWPNNAVILANPQAARDAVDEYVAEGASGIKVYFRLSLDSIAATCSQADRHGVPVTAHLELVDASDAIRAGMDGIEHITSFGTDLAEPDVAEKFRSAVAAQNDARKDGRYRLWATLDFNSARVRETIQLIVDSGVFVSPTLATFERRAGDRNVQPFHVEGFKKMLEFVGLCHEAGATIVTGSHTWSGHVDFGWAYQREMELLVECGLTPLEVIQASTVNNAKFFGCAERLGDITSGKLADLIFVEGQPHEDIRSMYNVRAVMQNGRFVHQEHFVTDTKSLFARENLVAWCIVPFDAKRRGPEERVAMLKRLGFSRVAYDWRKEHVPTFEEEIRRYKQAGLEFFAFWDWHPEIEPLIRKYRIRPQIWKTNPSPDSGTQEERVKAAAEQLLSVVDKAGQLGCQFGIYNHGGWGGEPENLVAVCRYLREHHGADHVGIVYNFHHGHEHIERFESALATMLPELICLNINGMNDGAEPKIVALGKGQHEAKMLRIVSESGYRGPIGVLDHRSELDAEESLQENLSGLDTLLKTH